MLAKKKKKKLPVVKFSSVSVRYPGDKTPNELAEKKRGGKQAKENCKIAANNNGKLTGAAATATANHPPNHRTTEPPTHTLHRSGWLGTNAYVTLWWRRDIRMSHNST